MARSSLIMVSYTKREYSELALESLLASEPCPDEIIVIDNGSTDDSLQYLDEQFRRRCNDTGVDYVLIGNDKNVGACTARNQGLAAATGEYIAFSDNDTVVRTRNWLATLNSALEADVKTGIVGPKLVFPFQPYDIECAGVGISQTGRVRYFGRGAPIGTEEYGVAREVQTLTSAFWLMRREVVEDVGGLDDIFSPAQFEDFDLCYRARESGWRIMYEPSAEIYHFENTTTDGSVNLNFKYVTMRNWQVFKKRWRHMFEQEDGPSDADCTWAQIRTRPLEHTGKPPMVGQPEN